MALPAFDALPMDFFRRLYAQADGGSLEVRGLSSDKPPVAEWFSIITGTASYQKAMDYAARINAGGYDVFFGVNPRTRFGQEDKDVLAGVALWADIDDLGSEAAAAERLSVALAGPLHIDAGIFSGGGLHLYHFLKEPIDPADEDWSVYCRSLKATAGWHGGDPKCTNVSRILRFPGTLSYKRNERVRVWLNADHA
jgi:hypothetical protein